MKKISTLLLAVGLPMLVMAQAKTVPYSSDMDNTDWTIINETEGSPSWEVQHQPSNFDFAGKSSGLYYKYSSSYAADDWAVSPYIHLEGGKEYKVKFWYRTMNDVEKLTLYMAKGSDPQTLLAGEKLQDLEGSYSNSNKGQHFIKVITPETSGDYTFGFYLHSDKNKWNSFLTAFEVVENVFYPGPVTSLSVAEGAERALEATLSWALPTLDNDGAPMPEGKEVTEVRVYRDDVLVATLGKDATTWKDDASKGLTSGFHKYGVEAVIDGKATRAEVSSRYIGPLVAASLPYSYETNAMTDSDFETFFTVEAGPTSTVTPANKWHKKGYEYSGFYIDLYASGFIADDWLFLPPVKIEKAGLYRFGFNAQYAKDKVNSGLETWVGKGPSIAQMEKQIGTYPDVPYEKTDLYGVVELTEPGEYTFAVRVNIPEKRNVYYYHDLRKFTVEEWHVAPTHVADLKAEANGEDVVVSWTNPAKSNVDTDLASITKAEIYRNGELLTTLTEGLTPGAATSWTDAKAPAGSHVYKVVPYLNEFAAEGEAPTCVSPWMGDKLQQLPYSYTFNSEINNRLFSTKNSDGKDPEWVINTTDGAKLALAGTEYFKPDDQLYTPPFELVQGYYTVKLGVVGACNKYGLKVGYAADENSAIKGQKSIALTGSSYRSTQSFVIKVDEAGRGMFVINANDYTGDKANNKDLQIVSIDIEHTPLLPGIVEDLAIEVPADKSLKATLTWTNPSKSNIDGVEPTIEKAIIYRNGEELATVNSNLVAGQQSSYVDNSIDNAGYYTYKVVPYTADGCSATAAKEVKSAWIGDGMNLPYQPANFNDWTLINVDGDTNTWGDPLGWSLKDDGERLNMFCTSKPGNDWAISPRLNLVAGETYEIKFTPWLSMGTDAGYTFDLYAGTGDAVADMTQKLLTVSNIPFKANREPRTIKVKAVAAEEPALAAETAEADEAIAVPAGVVTFGFYANKAGDGNVADFSVVKVVDPLVGIENVAADGIAINGNTICFGAEATDIIVADMTGKVLRNVAAGETIEISTLAKGTYIVSAKIGGKRTAVKVVK